jgi:hypothetical protein
MEDHWQGRNSMCPLKYLYHQTRLHDISSWHNTYPDVTGQQSVPGTTYRYAPHKDVSVNDGLHIRQWSHKIMIF